MTGGRAAPAQPGPLRPWVKICGVTRPEDAELAARLGARFVGVNFWSGSRRRIDAVAAREIAAALPESVELVGVFVDETPALIEQIVELARLDLVQLHGDEPDEVVARFAERAIRAFRADDRVLELADRLEKARRELARNGAAAWDEAVRRCGLPLQWKVFASILDCGSAGRRYGGTGEAWDWSRARPICERSPVPVLIAGGIDPSNVGQALSTSGAAGVDVATGVESSPGIKDREKMERLFEEIARVRSSR